MFSALLIAINRSVIYFEKQLFIQHISLVYLDALKTYLRAESYKVKCVI